MNFAGHQNKQGKGQGVEEEEIPLGPPCHICSKFGHIATTCFCRYDHGYQSSNNQLVVTMVASTDTSIYNIGIAPWSH